MDRLGDITAPREPDRVRGATGAVRRVVLPRGYETVGAREAEERFGLSADVDDPDPGHAPTVRLYGTGLHIRGDLVAPDGDGKCADNIVVDGDLVIDGALKWWEGEDPDGPHKFLLVTGDLKAHSVHLGERVDLVVRGDMEVTGGVHARSVGEDPMDGDTTLTARNVYARYVSLHGHVDMAVRGDLGVDGSILCRGVDDRGSLSVAGRTRAGELVTADWFTVTLTGPREVARSAEVHLEDLRDLTELREEIRPELLGDAEDTWDLADRIEAAWAAGLPLLRDTPGPLLAASAREVERLREEAAQVTELDLAAHRALWQSPEGVLDFTALRRLRLAGRSSPDRLLPRLAELAYLEELDISGMALEELPEAIARLPRLKVLDISGNPFRALPDQLGGFTGLRVLRARDLCCPLPHTLSRLPALEELDLSWLQPAPAGRLDNDPYLVPFPRIVTRLPALRSLNLYGAVLDSVHDDLLRATALEELDLGGALGRVESLPELSRLPRLRTLRMNGNAGNADRAPAPHLLDRVWEVTTLEELALDCWGEETCRDPRTGRYDTLRPPLTLPNDAFARMPRLRVLNLEFSRPTTLPESFYALTALEDVQVDFSALDAPTRQRLASLARSEPDNPARDWIRALQARLLLKAGRPDDAYRLTERILTRRPGFRGLAGIVGTADYRTWRDRAAGQ